MHLHRVFYDYVNGQGISVLLFSQSAISSKSTNWYCLVSTGLEGNPYRIEEKYTFLHYENAKTARNNTRGFWKYHFNVIFNGNWLKLF